MIERVSSLHKVDRSPLRSGQVRPSRDLRDFSLTVYLCAGRGSTGGVHGAAPRDNTSSDTE